MQDHCFFYQDTQLHSSLDRTPLCESINLHNKDYRRNIHRLAKTTLSAQPHGTVSKQEEFLQTLY